MHMVIFPVCCIICTAFWLDLYSGSNKYDYIWNGLCTFSFCLLTEIFYSPIMILRLLKPKMYLWFLKRFKDGSVLNIKTSTIKTVLKTAGLINYKKHAASARKKGADIVVAVLHLSIEFETYPIQNVIDMGHKIKEHGNLLVK